MKIWQYLLELDKQIDRQIEIFNYIEKCLKNQVNIFFMIAMLKWS